MGRKTVKKNGTINSKAKYVVSIDNEDYYVVTSISQDRAIQLVGFVSDISNRKMEIIKVEAVPGAGHNDPPEGGDRPGPPGGSRGKKNAHTLLPGYKINPGTRALRAHRFYKNVSIKDLVKKKGIVKKITRQEALDLIAKNNTSKKK